MKRAASKMLGNVRKHCPGLTLSTKNRLKNIAQLFIWTRLWGDLDLLDRPHAQGINHKRSSFSSWFGKKWICLTQRFILLNPVFFYCGPLLCLVEMEGVKLFRNVLFQNSYNRSYLPFYVNFKQWTDHSDREKDISNVKQTEASKRNWNISQWWLQSRGGHSWVIVVKDKCEGNCDEQGGLF